MTDSADSKSSGSPDSRSDRRTADFGIVCSHRAEIKGTLRQIDRVRRYSDEGCNFSGGFLRETSRVALVEAGNGFARHRRATEILIREHRPRWVLSVGFCSALSPDIRAGDLVLASHLADTHGNEMDVACRIPESRRVHVGHVVVADSHPMTQESKTQLAESSRAIAVDTVSLAVAQVCHEQNVRFLCIRGVVDAFDEWIPERAGELVFAPTSRAWGGALGGMARSLGRVGELNEWRKRTKVTSEHLGQFVSGVLLRIAEHLHR